MDVLGKLQNPQYKGYAAGRNIHRGGHKEDIRGGCCMKLKRYLTLTRAGIMESLQFRLSMLVMVIRKPAVPHRGILPVEGDIRLGRH